MTVKIHHGDTETQRKTSFGVVLEMFPGMFFLILLVVLRVSVSLW